MLKWLATLLIGLIGLIQATTGFAQDALPQTQHLVEPGDTWLALALRYGVEVEALRFANPHPNRQRQPAIGRLVTIPAPAPVEINGTIISGSEGGVLQRSASLGADVWQIALLNDIRSPYLPLLYRPIFVRAGDSPPKELPAAVTSMEVSRLPARPGQPLGIRGEVETPASLTIHLSDILLPVFQNNLQFVAVGGTGAFLEPGDYSLSIRVVGEPLWSQPWLVEPGDWTFEQITYTGAAAEIDAEAIRQERERLAIIWNQLGDQPQWSGPFALPLNDFLEFSSLYGARRSYNGGPYDRYHEGLDFSAYGGTPVYAPAAGTVAIAEELIARGGAVILDHGLGIYSGFYHLSEILVEPGQTVTQGHLLGRVGSTGLSTGNHLHWDLLAAGTWVDPMAWIEQDMACWLLEGWGVSCNG
ncbi:MAG: peptidoglycan DD-metalloendopeptidase family protein [Chloroflexota bacterium]|nr:MAG: peptidoglycan DD-metalloendopeptidase family protein [Chloroflexota bacterium]